MTRRPQHRISSHAPPTRRLPAGAALLGLVTLVAAASLALAAPTGHAIYCERMAPLGVLAGLAATLIALCFRALAVTRNLLIGAALLLACISLFASARFLAHYHGACSEVQQRLDKLRGGR